MIILGNNLIVKVGGTAIAAAKSCRLSISADRQEVASASDGKWRHYKWGRQTWKIQATHLVTTIARSANMVGTTVSVEVGLSGEWLPFSTIVDNVTTATGSYSGTPNAIVWDKTQKQFLGVVYAMGSTTYYEYWTNSTQYTNPDDYALFTSSNGVTYTWLDGDLTAEKLTGSADVLSWDCQGSVGHLASGDFEFGGNGALTAASTA